MQVRLVLTLKQSVRRCLYRRWEGQVVGRVLRTKTVDLERLYRGNTPYPVGKVLTFVKTYHSSILAKRALCDMATRLRGKDYRALIG